MSWEIIARFTDDLFRVVCEVADQHKNPLYFHCNSKQRKNKEIFKGLNSYATFEERAQGNISVTDSKGTGLQTIELFTNLTPLPFFGSLLRTKYKSHWQLISQIFQVYCCHCPWCKQTEKSHSLPLWIQNSLNIRFLSCRLWGCRPTWKFLTFSIQFQAT